MFCNHAGLSSQPTPAVRRWQPGSGYRLGVLASGALQVTDRFQGQLGSQRLLRPQYSLPRGHCPYRLRPGRGPAPRVPPGDPFHGRDRSRVLEQHAQPFLPPPVCRETLGKSPNRSDLGRATSLPVCPGFLLENLECVNTQKQIGEFLIHGQLPRHYSLQSQTCPKRQEGVSQHSSKEGRKARRKEHGKEGMNE